MKKTIETQITLISSSGKTIVPMKINYDDDEDAIKPESEINMIYNSIEYQGKGEDFLWVDTIADLQHKLPQDTKIACCMTCQHGSMCPYGDAANELFCTKDLTIQNKEDLCQLFVKTDPYAERKVSSFNYCDDFVYQSNEYYTYNDFLYELHKKR